MEISQQDKLLLLLQNELDNKKSNLVERYKEIQETSKINSFLKDVVNDYQTYYNYINQQKQSQQMTLQMVLDYLDNLLMQENLTEESIKFNQQEQEKILLEMNKIKKELDDITDITSHGN
jgi:hypothetical protein